ncbi:MAG: hypothetical protein H0T51_08640 [Pirellulales bacterium]|nr:hypothetical protein [Pirellulales bacterium]
MTLRPLLLALRLLPLRQDAAMFLHHSSTHRSERAPTAVELWAQREATSPTMAADLLLRAQPSANRRTSRGVKYTALLAIAAVVLVASLLSR